MLSCKVFILIYPLNNAVKGTPKLPPLSTLPREQIELIESFIEKHELEISIGRQKTAKFIFNIYQQEEMKRKNKEKYSRKLLKDAENLILSMQISPVRRSHIEPGGAGPVKRKDFSKRKAMESERIQSETKEEQIRRRLKKFIEQDDEAAEKLVNALLKREDGVELAEKVSYLFLDIWLILNSPGHSAELPSGDAARSSRDSHLASLCGELGGIVEEIGVADIAGELYLLQADSLREKEPEKASGIYLKAAELLFQGDTPGRAARAFEKLLSLSPQERKKTLDSLNSRLSDSEKAGNFKEAAKLSSVLADIFEDDSGQYAKLKEKEAGNWMKCGEFRDAASTYAELAGYLGKEISYKLQGAPVDEAKELTETLSPRIASFYEKSAKAYIEHAKHCKPEDSKYFFAQAAENYSKAAYSAPSEERKGELLLKAAENYPKAGRHAEAARSFVNAGDILLRKNPAKAADSYGKAMKAYTDAGEYEESYQQHFNLQQALGRGEAFDSLCKKFSSMMVARAKAHEKEGMHSEAGNAYNYAAELVRATYGVVPSPQKRNEAFRLQMKAAESYERGEKFHEAGGAYSRAAHHTEKRNPEEAIRLYEKSAEAYLRARSNPYASAGELKKAANLATKTNPGKALWLYGECAERYADARDFGLAAKTFLDMASMVEKTNPEKAAEFYEKAAENLLKANDIYKAAEAYQLAIQANPEAGERLQPALFVLSLKAGRKPEVPEFLSRLKKAEKELIIQAINYNGLQTLSEIKIGDSLREDPVSLCSLLRLNLLPTRELVAQWPSKKAEITERARKRADFDPKSELHLQVEYGRYLAQLKSISKEDEWFLDFGQFRKLKESGKEEASLSITEKEYTRYEVEQSAEKIRPLLEKFGDITLIGNMRTGHLYAIPIHRKLGKAGFYDTARMGSSELHSKEYILKPDLIGKATTHRLLNRGIPCVVVDATPSENKVPDAFKGYRAWVAAMDLVILERKGVKEEEAIKKTSELTSIPEEIVRSISAELKTEGNAFRKMASAWALRPEHTPLIRVYDMDLDSVGAYRIKREHVHEYTDMQEIKNEMPSGKVEGEVPFVLFQPSMGISKIPVSVQERIGAGLHRKGYLDDLDHVLGSALHFDREGVHLSANIAETIADKLEE